MIAKAGRGEAFILQGGDCAESFNDCRSDIISQQAENSFADEFDFNSWTK